MKNSTESRHNAQVTTGTFYFDPADSIYNDHFPGYPVVPGSMIVHAFFKAIKKTGLDRSYRVIEDFRFRKFLLPGKYDFSIHASPEGLKCRLYQTLPDRTRIWVTGTIRA
jgi:3-hydroxyacyl-[acyl-carrier-protein] dehydratase